MYRNDDKRVEAEKWQGWADFLQFGSIGFLFVLLFLLETMPREAARVFVWYGAGFLFITATAGFVIGLKAHKKTSLYLDAEGERIKKLFDKAIKQEKDNG